jgi:glycosyltransferase involved in cell wall biosynthesis
MQKKPLVSIIMNCLNGSKYLNEAIKSVLDQTYRNWEIIFFDNNSTDQSRSILQKYNEKRIKYFKSKVTHTLYKARNLAVKKSKGDLIAFLDVDDWWTKNKLKKQVNFFLTNKAVDVIYSNVFLFNEKKKKKKIFIKKKLNTGKITQKLINKYELPILSSVVKKKVFDQIKFDNRFTIIGDFDFFVRLSLIRNISAIQEPLAYYRIHSFNLSKKKINLNIKELEIWLSEKKKEKKFKNFNFSRLYSLVETLKIQKYFVDRSVFKLFFGVFRKFKTLISDF